MQYAAEHAMIRFGLGRKGAEPLPPDPRGWLLDQLDGPDPASFDGLPTTIDGLAIIAQKQKERRAAKAIGADPAPNAAPRVPPKDSTFADALHADQRAQMNYAFDTVAPFRERLVWFWANHFTVSSRRGEIAPLIGPYVREAIRPHVTGRFVDMLMAVMRHPAMLLYLDNATSAGPNSRFAATGDHGLNENLARESLELHTVTPAAGYTQADVTNYARILTGWSVARGDEPPGFRFRPFLHEPGSHLLMGQEFGEGEQGGIDAITFLGTHATTYHAVATALARHFIADIPPPEAVAAITSSLTQTGGNLAAAAQTLVDHPDAWQPLTKLRTPQDYVVAVVRALDLPANNRPDAFAVMGGLGQPVWSAPLPNGWSDRAPDWAASDALLRRADWAFAVSGRAADAEPDAVAQGSLGGLLHPATAQAMQHAGSRRDALTLLFSSPEFMRR